MDVLELARWQFGITTIYHFLFVPLTIGLSALVAVLQTIWWRTDDERYLRLTKFFGTLFLVNVALGVVTGIVQEFQFGMNWSDYSRFVGDVFGAPLALEGLLAFFLESTFIGLWVFGWDRLPRGLHLACIWAASVGSVLSAYFILAANSFMQNPVGFGYDAERDRAVLTDFWAVLTNPVVLVTLPHTLFAAFMVAGAFMAAVALWHLVRRPDRDAGAFRVALRMGAATVLVAGLGVVVSGDLQGKVMTEVQPMKMAAAEGLYATESPASFSLLTIGTLDGSEEVYSVKVPRLLSFLGTGTWDGEVRGIDDLQAEYADRYGAGDYSPNVPVTYWTFRMMITAGGIAMAAAAWLLWATRRGRVPSGRLVLPLVVALPLLPLAANVFGWVFTEMGRQPWLVFGLLPTASGVSPGTTVVDVAISMTVFTLLYAALAVVEVALLVRVVRGGLPEVDPPPDPDDEADDAPLTFAH